MQSSWRSALITKRHWHVLWFLSCGHVGETGIGKSTLMDTLFNTKFESDPATHNEPGVRLKARSYELQESNVRLKLTIVDTVGFGDQINKDDRYILGFWGDVNGWRASRTHRQEIQRLRVHWWWGVVQFYRLSDKTFLFSEKSSSGQNQLV